MTSWIENRVLRGALLATGLVFSQFSAAVIVPLAIESSSTPQGGRIYVPTQMAGFESLMRLDTGATTSRIRLASWNKNLPIVDHSESVSASGQTRSCDMVQSQGIALRTTNSGKVMRSNYVLSRCPDESSEDLFGLDFFIGTQVRFDFNARTIELNEPAPTATQFLPLKIITTGDPLLALPLKVDSNTSYFGMVDSGAEISAVDERYVHYHENQFEFIKDVAEASDAAGKSWTPKLYRMKELAIAGGKTLKDVLVIVYDFGYVRQALGTETPFILGYNVLSQFNWTFDLKNIDRARYSVENR